MGVVDVLNECLRPRGSEEAFVTKLDALHGDGAKFAKHRYERLHGGPLRGARDLRGRRLARPQQGRAPRRPGGPGRGSSRPSSRACSAARRRRPRGRRAKTVLAKFKGNLASLLDEVERTEVRYVRCVKPNGAKAPRRWDAAPSPASSVRGVGAVT
ncbi:hypothetical protein JL720_13595 [Aureococcus anophagefferens]|nr:hypothetical protein JL720_13595 [Aureococcus anophagefferens]